MTTALRGNRKAPHLDGRYVLDVWANGAVTVRERSAPMSGGLPVYSVDTLDEAVMLQVRHCRLSRTDNETYFLNSFSGDVDDLRLVTKLFDRTMSERERVAS